MPVTAFARFKGFYSICHQHDNNLSDIFIERRLEEKFLGLL
jgi:hypothetical protein